MFAHTILRTTTNTCESAASESVQLFALAGSICIDILIINGGVVSILDV